MFLSVKQILCRYYRNILSYTTCEKLANRKEVLTIECIRPMIRIEYNQQYQNKQGGMSYIAKIWSPEFRTDNNWYDTDFNSAKLYSKIATNEIRRINVIPCNRCAGCRLSRAADTAVQCTLEKMNPIYNANECWFLTFTYDDAYIPIKGKTQVDTGEIIYGQSVDKHDLQKFWKKMRKGAETKNRPEMPNLMYLNCNEYGKHTYRAHAHALVFGMPLDPTKFISRGVNSMGDPLYESPILNEWWGKGAVIIGEMTFRSASYTARYTLKKTIQQLDDWWYFSQGKDKENISRSQNIGKWYYDQHKEEIYETDTVPVKDTKGNLCKPPKSFDRLYKKEFPEKWELVRKKREQQKLSALWSREQQTELKGREYLAVLEELQKDFKDLRGEGLYNAL